MACLQHLGHDGQGVPQLQTLISHSSPHLPVWRDSQHSSFVEQCRSRLSVQALSTWLGSQASEVLHDPPSPSSGEEGGEQYSALRSLMEDRLGTQGSLLLQPSWPGGQQQLGHVAGSSLGANTNTLFTTAESASTSALQPCG
ncbi:hypothetical protein V8C86DRAFT_3135386 [Haematococcus lacustris]